MSIKVVVNGAQGRMGQETVKALATTKDLDCVATCSRGEDVIKKAKKSGAQVVIDFTLPTSVFSNTMQYIEAGLHPVIGTSGLTTDQIEKCQQLAAAKGCGGVIAPNFSIAVVLMTQFAAQTAKYYPHAEIIEMHHEKKQDAPSGTAIKTAKMIAANRTAPTLEDASLHNPSRGARIEETQIHAIRLPGCVAHQEVIFGAPGELFTLRHDTLHRSAFMPGVLLACRQVVGMNTLVYGLETLLEG